MNQVSFEKNKQTDSLKKVFTFKWNYNDILPMIQYLSFKDAPYK